MRDERKSGNRMKEKLFSFRDVTIFYGNLKWQNEAIFRRRRE